ncbi:gliding motility lipoprotein GldH [Sediminibacterium sp. TEGAF015]|uniref:gliding motility lipoprotein GldH n=1 Tax=Sediminibacterium sp. TEGAF015 TaxID=575378 RepID=UPI0021FCFE3B|nr:gliding motility lipoprotein GldH [Sediminibacterium sp. TEGAF015]BDQ13016.1 hypothetical protein TEGAF0_22330 [Sediminibacterium sp. TEGAF015]
MKTFLAAGLVFILLSSCQSNGVFEKVAFFQKHEWESKYQPDFQFAVTDTNALYHIYAVIRHEDAYRYNNLWVQFSTQSPGESAKKQLLNLRLADNRRGWLGSGMDDVFDHRIRLTQAPIKLKSGTYSFKLQQAMREDPLPNMLNAGVRVEKVAK